MIRSVLYLDPRGRDGNAIAEFYRRHRVLERACEQDGCLKAELQLPTSGTGAVLVTALWRDADAYQGWLDNPWRAASSDELAELVEDFDGTAKGELYEIVVEAVPAG
ncbi:MAG: antibiotic biosynthesis monooxygenase family protein [Gaiellaceae bacterium]